MTPRRRLLYVRIRAYSPHMRWRQVAPPKTGIERVLAVVDGVRGLFGSLLFGAIGVAAIRSGGTAGNVVGIAFLTLAALTIGLAIWRAASGIASGHRG